jgi:hypothetical protein
MLPYIGIAQNLDNDLQINHYLNYYYIDNKAIYSFTYELINNGDINYWFWFEKKDLTNKSEKEIIREHFFKVKGDWSLYQIAFDGNVESYYIELFSGFVKYVAAKERFLICVFSKEEISESTKNKVLNYLNKHIIVFPETILSQYVNGLSSFHSIVFYKGNYILLPIEFIKF